MRILVFAVASAFVVWAAVISVSANSPAQWTTGFVASTIVVIAIIIQKINSLQKWLAPKDERQEHAGTLAQQALVELCLDRQLKREFFDVCVHVWEIPRWYRRLSQDWLRYGMREVLKRSPFERLREYAYRPKLKRVAAFGLTPPVPTGVSFRAGVGLIGVCIANNNRFETVTYRRAENPYGDALNSQTEAEWRQYGPKVTQGLSLADAIRLSQVYGEVIAKVIQDHKTGRAIGCATISITNGAAQSLSLSAFNHSQQTLDVLVRSAARALA